MEAICWRELKTKVPKTKQMIYLTDVLNINESFRSSRAGKKFSNLKIDEECFFSIETKDRTFDLLASNIETKRLWVKTIHLLVLLAKNKLKEGSSGAATSESTALGDKEFENVAKQFAGNLGNVQNEVEEIKRFCRSNEKKLKKNFLDLAEEVITKEVDHSHKLDKAVRVLDQELQEV